MGERREGGIRPFPAFGTKVIFIVMAKAERSKKKQDFVILKKGVKHFSTDVYRMPSPGLFSDTFFISLKIDRKQLIYPHITWSFEFEAMERKANCIFCLIAFSSRNKTSERLINFGRTPPSNRLITRISSDKSKVQTKKSCGLAPLTVTIRNVALRRPVSITKVSVCGEYKKLIHVKMFKEKMLLAGDQCEVSFRVDKNEIPFGCWNVPITLHYQKSIQARESHQVQNKIKFIVASPLYDGRGRTKQRALMRQEENDSEKEFLQSDEELNHGIQGMDSEKVCRKSRKKPGAYLLSRMFVHLDESLKSRTPLERKLQEKLSEIRSSLTNELTPSNYAAKFKAMLNLEEYHEAKEIEQFKICGAQLSSDNRRHYKLKVGEGLEEGRPSIMSGDKVLVLPQVHKEINSRKSKKCFIGKVIRIGKLDIVFECDDLHEIYKPSMKFNVEFLINRFQYQLCYRALQLLDDKLLRILLPVGRFSENIENRELSIFIDEVRGNPEQVQAITNIVNKSSSPYPYIIFGPPGTGKTKTMVETILQNWLINKNQLVCASSNSAADVIVEELLKLNRQNTKFIPENNILRIYSGSVDILHVSERILQHKIHNFDDTNTARFPSMEVVLSTPIIVGTLATAAKLSLEGVPENHFSHVFIDECGHCSEPESLMAVSGLITGERMGTQLVLAGDPQQLGTVVQCNLAEKYNYGFSILERLINTCEMYSRNPHTEKYDPEVLTKLSKNYRSHRDILKIPNELFYQGELKESGEKEVLNSCSQLSFLPQKNHPVIFHGVIGMEEQDLSCPSFYNLNEIDQIVAYIHHLIEEVNAKKLKITMRDIGVVAYYKRQVQKLLSTFGELGWSEIAVGSVDLFQGSEKLIIIISTVRSSFSFKNPSGNSKIKDLEFINDPKRFNVALTRAKALLIVVGDPEVLQHQSYWRLFIDYCLHIGNYLGVLPKSFAENNQIKTISAEKVVKKKSKTDAKNTPKKVEEEKMEVKKKETKIEKTEKENVIARVGGGDADKLLQKEERAVAPPPPIADTFSDLIQGIDIDDFISDADDDNVEVITEVEEPNTKIDHGDDEFERTGENNNYIFKDKNIDLEPETVTENEKNVAEDCGNNKSIVNHNKNVDLELETVTENKKDFEAEKAFASTLQIIIT